MKLTVRLSKVRLRAFHGLFPQERKVGNDFEVSVAVTIEANPESLAGDSIGSTVSYADLLDVVRREMDVPSALLEHVAWRIVSALKHDFPQILSGSVEIVKPTPPLGAQLAGASVELQW